MRRRELIIRCGSSVAWPLSARAPQPAMPVIGFLRGGSPDLQGLEEEGRT
jgi:putative ABC transport system substrate-binding protein